MGDMTMRQYLVLAVTVAAGATSLARETGPVTLEGMSVKAGRVTFELAPTGLPKQVVIEADKGDLPQRQRTRKSDDGLLARIGRGTQLREPMRIEVTAGGQTAVAAASTPARPSARGDAVACTSSLSAGGVRADLDLTYRPGMIDGTISYRGGSVDALELVVDIVGGVDTVVAGDPLGDETSRDRRRYGIPDGEGVVWGNAGGDVPQGGKAMPGVVSHLFVGSGDRGFTFLTDPNQGWLVDRSASTVVVTRNAAGGASLRVKFVNKTARPRGQKASFALLVHPSTRRPADFRKSAWLAWTGGAAARRDATLAARRSASAGGVVRADAGTVYEALSDAVLLSGPAGGAARSASRGHAATYPVDLFRYLAGTHTGLPARIVSNAKTLATAGDTRAHDRIVLGRALANDVGLDASSLTHLADAARVAKALAEFGYFEADGKTEFIPYWRGDGTLRFGETFGADDAFKADAANPVGRVRVSAYVRPADPRRGEPYHALIVILNEGDAAVRDQLYVTKPARLFGRRNELRFEKVAGAYDFSSMPEDSDWSKTGVVFSMGGKSKRFRVLKDVEDDGVVWQTSTKGGVEVYGPRIYVPAHSFRLLYGTGRR